jgi:hypothetical protein
MRLPRLLAVALAMMLSIAAVAGDEEGLCAQCGVIRPDLVATDSGCLRVAATYPIFVPKGFMIEIDYSYAYIPGCIPSSVSCTLSGGGVLKKSQLGVWHISNGSAGGAPVTAYFFKAHKQGQATISLVIDGVTYSYDVFVQ